MDPIMADFAGKVTAILTPYLIKGAEGFSKEFGKDMYNKAKNLLAFMKSSMAGSENTGRALDNYEKEPEVYESVLRTTVRTQLEEDDEFRQAIESYIKSLGSDVTIFQTMKKGEDITGLETERPLSGRTHVSQEIEEGKKITGVIIKNL
jgi:C-terminal processing protease CtpA/Prc